MGGLDKTPTPKITPKIDDYVEANFAEGYIPEGGPTWTHGVVKNMDEKSGTMEVLTPSGNIAICQFPEGVKVFSKKEIYDRGPEWGKTVENLRQQLKRIKAAENPDQEDPDMPDEIL